jgi:CO/xanthine dehydrogenase Mo-binding subunit
MTTATEATPTSVSLGSVGIPHERIDGREKVAGTAQYAADLHIPGMLHGKVLRSPHAHASIRSIEVEAALEVPGVVAILTGEDLHDIDPRFGHAIKDRPIVALDRVRFVGEPVAAVAAHSEAAAEEATRRIVVDYAPLETVVELDQAIAPDAVELHSDPMVPGFAHGLGDLPPRVGNVCYSYGFEREDVSKAFADAEIVVEGTYRFPGVYQYAMETHTAVAEYRNGEITLWANCQHPFLVRREISDIFGVELEAVRIIVPYLGGGFGSKSYTKMEPITVALARKAGRPVRIVNRVDESMATTRRHGMRARMRTAATSSGDLVAREVEIWLDTGAYADNGPRVTATAADAAPGPYRWEAVGVEANCVYTNTPPSGSYRAFGATHLQWIGEAQIDEVARRVGIGALDIRRRNLLQRGEEVRPGGKPLDADLIGDVEKAAAAIGWDDARPDGVGRGVSVGLLAAGAHPVSMATVRMGADGMVSVLVGSTEMGQGTRTAMAQIAAEVLGVDPAGVRVAGADTRFTPYDRSTGASRSTTVAGKAVERAARQVLAGLRESAAGLLDAPADELVPVGGHFEYQGSQVDFPRVLRARFGFSGGELIGHGEVKPEGGSGSYAEGPVFWEVCIAAAEVSLDWDTGMVRVLQTASVADVGRAINPLLVERQDEGATMQGLGNCLFEEMVFAPNGALLNDTLLDYRVPTFVDLPDKMTSIIVENEDGPGPFGAKGCGEGALAALPAAIVCAIADAGVTVDELPVTPERVWRHMQERNGSTPDPSGDGAAPT